MIKTNKDKVVKISVIGEVVSPRMGTSIYRVGANGDLHILPGTGGITYNVRVGDSAIGWMGDHIEPGVSVENRVTDTRAPQGQSRALNVLSCIGNEATVVKGDAKGAKGIVVGKHGGIEHVMVDFKPDVMEQLVIEDKIMIASDGYIQFNDVKEVANMNLVFEGFVFPHAGEYRFELYGGGEYLGARRVVCREIELPSGEKNAN